MLLVLVALTVAPAVGIALVLRLRQARRELRSSTVALEVDGTGVSRVLADGRTESVGWSEIVEVEVFRTRVGPHAAGGGMIMLTGTDTRGCLIPIDRLPGSGIVDGLSRLPGFSLRLLAEALEAEAPSRVVVWHRDA